MLVHEVIDAIQNNNITIKQLAEQHKVSDRTIQNKIKQLGFKWNAKEAKYNFIGSSEQQEQLQQMEFKSLFNQNNRRKDNNTPTQQATQKPQQRQQQKKSQPKKQQDRGHTFPTHQYQHRDSNFK